MSSQPTRYFSPSVTPHVESVSLDDFDLDEIRKYLDHHDNKALATISDDDDAEYGSTAGGLFIHPADLNRIETLVLCGQRDSARDALCALASEAIGRQL